jgi:uncharacterized protein YjbI with pentapeptide repeats
VSSIVARKRRLQGFQGNDETYTGLDLGDMEAWASRWINCTFQGCDLTLANFGGGSYFENCTFIDCDLTGASLRAAQFRDCTFSACNLRRAAFVGCSPISQTRFALCNMKQASFFEATVFETKFQDCNLHGADLRFIEGVGVDFTGSNLWSVAVTLGCSFWNAKFDARQVGLFAGMLARAHPDEEARTILSTLAGKNHDIACRLMDARGEAVEKVEA